MYEMIDNAFYDMFDICEAKNAMICDVYKLKNLFLDEMLDMMCSTKQMKIYDVWRKCSVYNDFEKASCKVLFLTFSIIFIGFSTFLLYIYIYIFFASSTPL